MKYIVLLGDGMADRPVAELNNKTPLMAAKKPNMDYCARNGICGLVHTIPKGMKPGSDVANLSVMGYAPDKYYTGRSPLEALSIGINMLDSDIAIRCNLVTLSDDGDYNNKTMVDYSAGEISTEEARLIMDSIEKTLGNNVFKFYSGVSYRHCLIAHNCELGTNFTPPHDISGKPIGDYLPEGKNGELMLDLMKRSYEVLKNHPVNLDRIKNGKNPASSIWLWGEGTKPQLPQFREMYGKNGAVISAVDLLKGIGIASGMEIIEVEGATGNIHTNFKGKAEACVNALKSGIDYVYLHLEAPDECGHQGDVNGKVKSIELIDELVLGYIMKELHEEFKLLIAPDHPTPLSIKTHSSEAVPFVIYSNTKEVTGVASYDEDSCRATGIELNSGEALMIKFLFDK